MKKYKKLQKQVNDSLSEIKDEQLLLSLKAQTSQNQQPKAPLLKRKWTWAFASVVAVLLVCVISLTVWLPMIDNNNGNDFDNATGDTSPPQNSDEGPSLPPPPSYDVADEINVSTSFEELNGLTQVFDVYPIEGFSVSKFVDGVTDDVLYFVVSGDNMVTNETYTIKIIVNKYYKEKAYDYDFNLEKQIGSQKLSYTEECEIDSEGYYNYITVAKIITEKERIYVQYSGVTNSAPNPFVASIQEILK